METTPLIYAIVNPQEETEIKRLIRQLISAKANINQPDSNGATPLMYSVGSEELVRFLIKSGANPKQKDKQGLTFLGYFAADQFEPRERMIASGYKPSINDDLAFLIKVRRENTTPTKTVQILSRMQDLVKKGRNQNLQLDGVSIVAKAVRDADKELVNLLVSVGVNCTAGIEKSERRELFAASLKLSSDNPALVECFLRGSKESDWTTQDGETILMSALDIGAAPQVIDVFINSGMNVNSKDNLGQTPLMYAAFGGTKNQSQSDSITRLIQAGANMNAIDSRGYTALMHAAAVWSQDELGRIKTLEDAGAKLDTYAPDNCSAAELSWLAHNYEIQKYLDSKGAQLRANNTLMCAVGSDKTADHQFESALKQTKDGKALDRKGRTALILAAQKCNYGWVKAIIKAGAPKYEKDSTGNTALHYLKLCNEYREGSTKTINKINVTELRGLLSY